MSVDRMAAARAARWPQRPADAPPVSYAMAHVRVRETRGPAREHVCAHCDGPAAQWAYDHTDPDEVRTPERRDRPGLRTYSADPAHYLPLCVRCHHKFDDDHAGRRSRGGGGGTGCGPGLRIANLTRSVAAAELRLRMLRVLVDEDRRNGRDADRWTPPIDDLERKLSGLRKDIDDART